MKKFVALLAIATVVYFPIAPLQAGFGGTDLILPAVGEAQGLNGSHFYTTIWVTNPSATDAISFEMSFLRSGQSNPNPPIFQDTLAPGATRAYENAAEVLFHAKNAVGALRIRSTQPLLVSSRIYNQEDGKTVAESQGLYSSGIPADFGIRNGQNGVLQGVRISGEFRYNIFFVETAGEPINLDVQILDANGLPRGGAAVNLGPWEHRSIGVVSLVSGDLLDGIARISATGGTGRAVVDRR